MVTTGTAGMQEMPSSNYLDLKCCALCRQDLPVDCFGDNAIRRDKKSPYCKPCVRIKTNESRARLKEMKMSITLTFSNRRRCFKCGEVYELRDMSKSDPVLCLWCEGEISLANQKPLQHFPDTDLTIAELSSMAQQGTKYVRRIPKAWKVK